MRHRSTEEVVEELFRDLRPVRPIPPLWGAGAAVAAAWLLGALLHGLFGAPPPGVENAAMWRQPPFLAVLVGLSLGGAGAVAAALAGAVPGREAVLRLAAGAGLAGLGLAALGAAWTWLASAPAGPGAVGSGALCGLRALLLGLLPGLAAAAYVARGLPRRPRAGAGAVAVGGGALGASIVHASCEIGSGAHVVLGHCLPPLVAAAVLTPLLAALVVRGLHRDPGPPLAL